MLYALGVRLLAFASTSLICISGSAFAQEEGVCYVDLQQGGSPCVCVSEADFNAIRPKDDVVLCKLRERQQLTRLSPGIPIDPLNPIDPTDPLPPSKREWRNNGIGNGVQSAPGNSDVTNGDAADGNDSGRSGPAGADGTAANGDPAGSGNNGNGDGGGRNNASRTGS